MDNAQIIPVMLGDTSSILTPSQYCYVLQRKAQKRDINPRILRKLYNLDIEIYQLLNDDEEDNE